MKKNLTLLLSVLFTITFYGQDLKLDHSYINSPGFSVGDTITIKFNTLDESNGTKTQTLWMFDYEYNNKLLEKIDHTFKITNANDNPNAQVNLSHWDGYKFNVNENESESNLYKQFQWWSSGASAASENSYPSNSDWSVERITIQDGSSLTFNNTILEVRFKIKDIGLTNYSDYSEVTHLNWMQAKDNSSGTDHETHAMTQKVNLGTVTGGNAGDVTIKIKTNAVDVAEVPAQDYWVSIYNKSEMDTYWQALNNGESPTYPTEVSSGQFNNASKDFTATGLENDTEYVVQTSVINTPSWLDNVVTVSDVALIFKEAIGAGSSPGEGGTSWDYHIQEILGEVTNDQKVDFDDSYEVLAHINGVQTSSNITSVDNGAFNLSGIASTLGSFQDNHIVIENVIKPTSSDKTFEVGHQLRGDVNFSHSFEPTATSATISTQTTTARTSMVAGSKYISEQVNIDLVSEIVDGNVVFTINSEVSDMVGAQFNIEYDKSRLVLDEVVFDTGNEMTNFSNHKEESGKIYIGSFDQNFNTTIKVGKPYKLIFIPTVELQNTSGLITFKVNEGVKSDGTQIKFIMQ